MKTQFKAGDLVRVQGPYKEGSHLHGFKSGQVVTVVAIHGHTIDVQGAFTSPKDRATGARIHQAVETCAVKLAKQAMREREALRMLDIGNIPTSRNKTLVGVRMRKHIQAYLNRRG